MLTTAYFDESGGRDTGLVLMSGYVAPRTGWGDLVDAWELVLGLEPKVSKWHMVDAARLQGEFANWTEKERDDRLRRLTALIRGTVTCQVTAAVRYEDYEDIVRGRVPQDQDNPDLLCAAGVVAFLFRARTRFGISRVDIVYDHKEETAKKRLYHTNDLRPVLSEEESEFLGTVECKPNLPMKDRIPLQAADILAWHQHRAGVNPRDGGARWAWMESILEPERRLSIRFQREHLRAMAEEAARYSARPASDTGGASPGRHG